MRASEARALAALALVVMAASLGSACTTRVLHVVDPKDPLLVDLVGWWQFDEGVGNMVARDVSGQGNDATLFGVDGADMATWPPGRAGRSLEISGAGYLQVPTSPSIDSIVDGITISAWVYYEGSIAVDYGTALSRAIGSSINQHYHLSIYKDDSPVFFITTVQEGSLTMGRITVQVPVPRFAWTHLAGTYDGSIARLYVNGVGFNDAPATGPLAAETNPLILGGNQNGATGVSERFPGRIDEIMLYRRALSPAEIARLANGRLFSSGPGDAGAGAGADAGP